MSRSKSKVPHSKPPSPPETEITETPAPISDVDKLTFALGITMPPAASEGETATPLTRLDDAARLFDIPVMDLVGLFEDKRFKTLLAGISKARASLLLNGPAMERLAQIIATGSSKDALTATRLLATITGDVKERGPQVNIKMSFEDLYEGKAPARNIKGLHEIFQISNEEAG